ncbi:MAG TPA: hypothetical protein VMR50_00445 [Myxococcota bacterium]|nr:hypothetical protein [Myxococcota bacterium]
MKMMNGHRSLEDGVLVAGARGLRRLDRHGHELWVNHELATDGVELGPIVGDAILGRGRFGDSGEWRGFAVSLATGVKIEWNGP